MTIAERIREYRKQPPYPSLRTMAQQLGVSPSYVSEMERGLKIFKGATLEKLATFLGTTVELLYEQWANVRILQISATAVGEEIRVACLLSDGTIRMA
jgi:transcriptional regulator with XRE-family HTH domain